MRKIALIAALVATAFCASAQTSRPRLVVGIVIDQMRWDYMYTYQDRFDGGGFARLLGEGFSCANTQIDYLPTVTACGHASIYTGATPALHGIAGNDYTIDGVPVSSVLDTTVASVGTTTKTGERSPRNLIATTIGDQLKHATNFQARVIGVSLKDRAAILPSGHAADGAYWYDSKAPGFITSTYYRDALPKWVGDFNRRHRDDFAFDLWNTPQGVTATFDLACAAVENEQLGADDVTDLLTVSISTTDAAAHNYGIHSSRVDSVYMQLDKDLARFFNYLDTRVGKGNYTLFLTADHGGTLSYQYAADHRLPARVWHSGDSRKATNAYLRERFGCDADLIKYSMEFSFYLNDEAIAQLGLDREEVKRAACEYISRSDEVMLVVDMEHIADAPVPQPLKERLVKGYNPKRSGVLHVMLRAGGYDGRATRPGSNHGSWAMSDAHIPLLFMGWGIEHGETFQPNGMVDIAPTICAMLHIQMPNACVGKPIPAIVK